MCARMFAVLAALAVSLCAASAEVSQKPAAAGEVARLSVADAEKAVRAHIFAQKPAMNPAAQFPLKEITPDEVFKRLNCQVFQVTDGVAQCASYLIRRGKVYPLGQSFGGSGVMSMCVADLDKDSKPELIYSFSFGSGIHRSHVALCILQPDGIEEAQVPFAYRDGDIFVKKTDDCNVSVEVGAFSQEFGKWTPKATLGKLELTTKDGKPVLDVKFAEDLPDAVRKAIWRAQAP